MGDKSSGEGPPPPSPLTGAYLLVVLPQTHQPQHKDCVIHNLTKGLLTWDKTDCHVDLEKELQTITAQAPEGEEAKNGERLIQFASENLVTEVLIHPQLNTLVQCMRNLLSSFTRHRHIIHAGYTCAGNGAWMLQDGTYSYADFAEMYQEHEVQRVLRAYENTVTVDVHCTQEGDWNNLKGKDPFSKVSRVRLNPKDCVSSSPAIKGFLDFLSPFITNGPINELLESSDVVGNIRFSHPTLYVFPGGQGDAALFGINGFNMLVDGGFARKACFWDFSRHLDRLDAVLMTRLNNGNVQGMTSLLQRKRMDHVYPQIGHFFCNLQERRHPLSPDGDKDRDPLLVSLFDQGQDILASLRHLQLKPQPCYRDPVLEPVNLYHKVGHGKLDMYVISPAKDSREVREFMAKWTTQDSKIFCSFTKRGGEFNFPLCNKVSICALLVWQPANPEDNITRLLFPGSTPQHKIFEGLDKLKNLEFMKHAVCSARTLSPSSSSVGLNVRTVSKPKVPASVDKIIENDDKKIEAVKQPIMKPPTGQTEKQPLRSQPPSRPPSKQKPAEKPKEKPKTEVEVKTEKTETAKTEKAKPDKIDRTEAVQKIEKPKEKPKRPITKQPEKKKPIGGEKKDSLKSSPTTPKKIAEKITENKVTEAQPKPEVKSRASSRTKPSPSATPAKSAKEANNRKVFEQKKEATKRIPPTKKEDTKKTDRSTAPRRSVPSPSKTDKQQVSPVKPRPVTKPKQDAKKIIKTEKDAVTESVVSTPSTVDVELAKAKEDLAEKEKKTDEVKVTESAEITDQPSLSKDEEDEILVIEKIEIEGDGKDKPGESIAVSIRNSREDIIADEEGKDEANVDLPSDEKREIMKTSDITIPDTDSKQFSEEVQDITKDAPDTSKSRVEFMTTEEASITKEPALDKLTPREKDGKEKSTDIGDIKQTDESQPDEKFSTTVESGATTAPTLPEDERIPLDEIKEGIEEKYIKEETKEKDIGVVQRPEQPTSLPEVPIISSTPFDQRVQLLKDIVKTPDEVADLPVHEEADGGIFAVDEPQLSRDLQKSRDDLLGIPPSKKTTERKEDAAEEIKLVKDENEKEDATKDLKEDDIALVEQDEAAVPPSKLIDQSKVDEDESSKPDTSVLKLDEGTAHEKEEMELIDNEAVKPSVIPASLEDEEILDEDKDKETEKEKLLPKESRDLDKDEDVADKASKEMINEKQVAKSVVEEEIKEKKPISEDGKQEEAAEQSGKQVELLESKDETIKLPSVLPGDSDDSTDKAQLVKVDVTSEPKSETKIDLKSKTPSPEPLSTATESKKPEEKDSKAPSPLPKGDGIEDHDRETEALKPKSPELTTEVEVKDKTQSPEPEDVEKSIEPSKSPLTETTVVDEAPKSTSPDLKGDEGDSVETIAKAPKSPSPEPKAAEGRDAEVKTSKSASPEPKAAEEAKDIEPAITTSPSPSPKPKEEEAKDDEVIKTSKSPSPEPKADDKKDTDVTAKMSKSPSPQPKIDDTKEIEPIIELSKSQTPEPKAEEVGVIETSIKASVSPSPEPKVEEAKDVIASTKSPKSLSPEPKVEEAKDIEATVKSSKSPSPEPKVDEVKDSVTILKSSKSPSPEPKVEEAKGLETVVKTSKSPSPEPKVEEAKDVEAIVKSSKSPSPEPKVDEVKDSVSMLKSSKSPSPEPKVEEAKGLETVVKTSKSPSPEPKVEEAKDVEAIVKSSKSPSPEPKVDEVKDSFTMPKSSKTPSPEPKIEEGKDAEAIVKSSKSPSPEPKIEEGKDAESIDKSSKSPLSEPKVDEAKDSVAILKSSKSPSPEPKVEEAKGLETVVKTSKSPSPEPKVEEAKDVGAIIKSSKSPSPEPKVEEAKDVEAILKLSKSPSPEPKLEETKDVGTIAKPSKSPTPEPKIEEGKDAESIDKSSKSPLSEPKVDEAKDSVAILKSSKSPSPEPKVEAAKDVEVISHKSPSPGPEIVEAKDVEAIVKSSKSPSPEPKVGEPKGMEAIIKSSKSPSPEPKVDVAEVGEVIVKSSKSPSPEPKVEGRKDSALKTPKSPSPEPMTEDIKDVETLVKASKSPSPEPKIVEGKDVDSTIKTSKSPSPVPKAEEIKDVGGIVKPPEPSSPEPKADDVKANEDTTVCPSSQPKIGGAGDIVDTALGEEPKLIEAVIKSSKSPSPEPKLEKAEIVGESMKVSKSPSPEPKTEDAKGISKSPDSKIEAAEVIEEGATAPESPLHPQKAQEDKDSVSPKPEPLDEVAKHIETTLPGVPAQLSDAVTGDVEAISKASKSPSPELKDIEAASKASKSPSPDLKKVESEEVGGISEVTKIPSSQTETDQVKDIGDIDELTKSDDQAKVTDATNKSPDNKAEDSLDINSLNEASKSPSPKPKDDQPGDTESPTASPLPKPDEIKDLVGIDKSSSGDPSSKPEDIRDADSIPKGSKALSPEPVVGTAAGVVDIEKISKSPTPEPKGEMLQDSISKPTSPDTTTEGLKIEKLKEEVPKLPSQEPSDKVLQAEESQTVLSKSPTPEPKAEVSDIHDSPGKGSITTSPEPKAEDLKPDESSTPVAKSVTPDQLSQDLKVVEPEEKQSKSPSPEPKMKLESPPHESTDVKSLAPGTQDSKSLTPEPSTDLVKGLEAVTPVSKSPSPEPDLKKAATSPEVKKDEHLPTKPSKSPSPEPITEMIESEPTAKASTHSPVPTGDGLDEKSSIIHESKDKELSLSKSPELQSDISKDVDKTLGTDSSGDILESLELSEESKTKMTDVISKPSDDVSKSLPTDTQTKVTEMQESSVEASSKLGSETNISKSPSPEPIMKDSKLSSPLKLESDDEKTSIQVSREDDVSAIKGDEPEKKVKTKEELNQELMEEKEVDEVSEPEKKDQANLLISKLDGEGSLKSSSTTVESFADSKAESSKLEAEKHEKETAAEELTSGSPKTSGSIDSSAVCSEKQVIDEKEIDQSSTKKLEEFKIKEDEAVLEKHAVESKSLSGDLGSNIFKIDDRVPSISLREASIEQTSEEIVTPKTSDIDKAPVVETDVSPASLDRKLSSGEVSTKSTDGDEKERKLSGTDSIIGSSKSGDITPKDVIQAEDKVDVVGESISRIESLEKAIPLTGEKLELDKENQKLIDLKGSTKLELEESDSSSSTQAKSEEQKAGLSTDDTKAADIEKQDSLPESIKLEAEKVSVEVLSKDSLKDEALVLDLDVSGKDGKIEPTVDSTDDGKEVGKISKEQVSKVTEGKSHDIDEGIVLKSDGTQEIVFDDSTIKSGQSISSKTSLDGAPPKSISPEAADSEKDESKKSPAASISEKPEGIVGESKSDKIDSSMVADKVEMKDGDHETDKLSSKSPSPPTVLDAVSKEGTISADSNVKEDLHPIKDEVKTSSLTKSEDSLQLAGTAESQETVPPVLVQKPGELAEGDKELEPSSSTSKVPTTVAPSDVVKGNEEALVKSDEIKSKEPILETISVKSDEVKKVLQPIDGLKEEAKTESLEAHASAPHDPLIASVSVEPTNELGGKDIVKDASLEKSEKLASKTEIKEEIKETTTTKETTVKDMSSELNEISSLSVLGTSTTASEQLHFATSTVDSKQSLETIEPLVTKESETATVTVKPITEKDAGEKTSAVITKTGEPSIDGKILVDDSLVVKSSTESLECSKDSKAHPTVAELSLTNGKTASDIICETDEQVMKAMSEGKEHDAKKSDTKVTDILDTAERIVSSLNGKKTISDESSDYIPSFSETKSYSLTIEGKKGPSDEITVETKAVEEGDTHTKICTEKEETSSIVSKPSDMSSSVQMNGHSKQELNEGDKRGSIDMLSSKDSDVASSSPTISETQKKSADQLQEATVSAEKTDKSSSKSVTLEEDSTHKFDDKVETQKPHQDSSETSQVLTKIVSAAAATISEAISAIDSSVSSDLLKSSSSSTKESTTASPDLSRKSEEQISTSQKDGGKEQTDSKLNLAAKESLIDVTSSFLSMESGVSQSSERSMDLTGSSSKSGEKVTETTDRKSSLSSTQVEPPTEKEPIIHSATAALKTQKDFSRSETPASDILSDRDIEVGHCTPYSDTSSGQVSRAVTHVWETVEGRPESRHYDSDEDIPGSPMSISSHIPSPPQFEYDMSRPQDPMMMSSFYGSLPGDFEEGVKTLSGDLASAYEYSIQDKGDISLKKELGGDKLSASIRSSLTSTPESSPLPERRFEPLMATSSKEPSTAHQTQPSAQPQPQPSSVLPSSSSTPPKPDPIGKWDKPLGLPPPHSTDSTTAYIRWNPYKEWGKPLGLPSPAPPPREDTDIEVDTSGSAKTTPKKVSKMNAENNKYSSNAVKESSNKSKRSESPVKKATGKDSRKSGPTPVYMDLSYVPHHGNSNYATVEFFKRVRARYYVFSGTEPSKEVFNALLEAKQSWEDKDLEVTIIPTYDTDTLGYWIAENEETLSKLKIDLSPSASRCTINLQDHDTSCSAYRLEF